MYLFVYGTLMKGFHNHHIIENFPFLGEYETVNKFHLVGAKSKAFPYLTKYEISPIIPFTRVKGEVYYVSNEVIQRLDNLEGHPVVYTRQSIEVTDGISILNVNCYILDNEELAEQVKNNLGIRFDSIPSGNWRDYSIN
jgi:gamma-glutamylaminecyclotransferase